MVDPSGYEYQYYEIYNGKRRCTSVTLNDNWPDYLAELESIDQLADRKVERVFLLKTPIYALDDLRESGWAITIKENK